ncbi:MAG: hypothetical protein JWP65_3715 [Ramlibacter sp.]|jgi:hypothetical protein|uniref:hypothetical protein n=1 Tax=Ramlibacter sp. TaxID=1917967 RepID=UPI0026232AFF|nr:hypothetical protein [Ramlibacter sp.]MDB5753294.1 hypothetical protein [Ramlibacter sp.]
MMSSHNFPRHGGTFLVNDRPGQRRAPAPPKEACKSSAELQVVSQRERELHMLKSDLAAFQREELEAIGACMTTLLARAPRLECLRAYHAHEAARARTRECLRRLQAW